jgi:hypothetical protein
VDHAAEQPLFTVICVSHKRDVLDRWLLPSLRRQRSCFDLKVVDSAATAWRSCAAALNSAARGARGRYLMFVHHDVAWDSETFLADVAVELDKLADCGIAGVVGSGTRTRWPYRTFRNAVVQGDPGELVNEPVPRAEVVQTLDELLLVVPAAVFRDQQFDETACDDWHLYGADYALTARRRGLKAYVLPFVVRHLSPGELTDGVYRPLATVRR